MLIWATLQTDGQYLETCLPSTSSAQNNTCC